MFSLIPVLKSQPLALYSNMSVLYMRLGLRHTERKDHMKTHRESSHPHHQGTQALRYLDPRLVAPRLWKHITGLYLLQHVLYLLQQC